ncbi:MAG: gluconate:H+ symporter [Bacteroidota bacterium]
MDYSLLFAVLGGIVLLLLLILYFRIPAFIALLVASIGAAWWAGLEGPAIIKTIQSGMGSTLGFVATVVGLGAMFGAILEKSGGAIALANYLIQRLGLSRAPIALVLTGFIVAIPVFFDVAFIILIPVIYALQRQSGRSLLLYAIPLLAGLAITHAFIPPTPGPIAVAEILGADLGWVILLGLIAGVPTALLSGLFFGRFIATKIHLAAPHISEKTTSIQTNTPPIGAILGIIAIPIGLILMSTLVAAELIPITSPALKNALALLGHPFTALILANLVAWYVLGRRRGFSADELLDITTRSMAPAGTIILLTGAGGVFKQVLVDTGAGQLLAASLSQIGLPILVFAFLAAVLIRIIQGSATVAMITAAGLVAPLLTEATLSGPQLATLVIAIASGASILSHVNDSGFWLVKEYLGMTEQQTFQSWSMMTTILALTGFICSLILFALT